MDEQRLLEALERGEAVVVSLRKRGHPRAIEWAKAHGRFVQIDRATPWGNPFLLDKDGTREEVITQYRQWIIEQPALMKDLHTLKGKALACWCHPLPCHGDVLLELIRNNKHG